VDGLSKVFAICTLILGFVVGYFVLTYFNQYTAKQEIPHSILATCDTDQNEAKLQEARTLLKKHGLSLPAVAVLDEPDLEAMRDFVWNVDEHQHRKDLIEPSLILFKSELKNLKGKKIEKLALSFALQPAAVLYVDAKDLSFSKAVATELEASQKGFLAFDKSDWHDSHQLSGLIAAKEGRIEDAKRLLIESVEHFEPTTSSFGPSMRLAKLLIEEGEFEAVATYFRKCKNGWSFAQDSGIDSWIQSVEAKKMPTGDGWNHQLGYL
jgi:hypothetical protein